MKKTEFPHPVLALREAGAVAVARMRLLAPSGPAVAPQATGRRAPVTKNPSTLRGGIAKGPSTSSVLVVLVGVLCVLGVVMVGSASEGISIATFGSPWSILLREGLWMAVGLLVFAFVSRVDYRRWRRFSVPVLVVAFALLLIVLAPGVGLSAGGASRWVGVGQLRLQPSELMKLSLVLFGADLVARRQPRPGNHRRVIGPLAIVAVGAGGLIMLQPDMGTALVMACITMALLFASGISMRPVLKVLGGGAAIAVVVAFAEPYRRQRLFSFLNPSAHASGSGYQVLQSLIGLGSGHLFGLGLGGGWNQFGSLPNAHTDFIYSVIGEELGIVGAVFVLALLVALAWFGLRAAEQAPDRFGAMLGIGLVAWIAAETFINIGAVVGLLPVTGIPLPFVSYGGSSLVITLGAAGMLVSIARASNNATPKSAAASSKPGRAARLVHPAARTPRPVAGSAPRLRARLDGGP